MKPSFTITQTNDDVIIKPHLRSNIFGHKITIDKNYLKKGTVIRDENHEVEIQDL